LEGFPGFIPSFLHDNCLSQHQTYLTLRLESQHRVTIPGITRRW